MEDVAPVGGEAGVTEPAFGEEGVGLGEVAGGAEGGVLGDGDSGLDGRLLVAGYDFGREEGR